ncbi:MAG: MoxR family ATPase [Planctomycetes bacterium]|nr:MoxR family ATPase [Planctomycetota bacterium]
MTETTDRDDVARLRSAYERIRKEIQKVIVGQDEVVDQLLISLFARGHCLLTGVPGLAKTLLISTLAKTLSLSFNRIQFTPDLMPSDITGTEVIQQNATTGERELRFIPGPVFANVILADEINRTPPKTQAAMLESMQEYQVTVAGKKHSLAQPFFVLATQNPIDQEGTYPLPEAQLDRFMFNIRIGYPTEAEELEIVRRTTAGDTAEPMPVLASDEILKLQQVVRRVPVAETVMKYAMAFARASRPGEAGVPGYVKESVTWGAGPRASQFLVLAAKARALLKGRPAVAGEDVRAVALPVLRHRILPNFSAEAEGITSDHLVTRIVETVPRAEADAFADGKLPPVLGS